MSATPSEELLDAIEDALKTLGGSPVAQAAVDELRSRLSPGTYWPPKTFEAAADIFGPSVWNTGSRTYKALDRRIRHAVRTWEEKYGPDLSVEQRGYADDVLVWAIRKAETDAGGDRSKLFPFVQAGIGRVIHAERVHSGMRQRAGYVDPSAILAELAS